MDLSPNSEYLTAAGGSIHGLTEILLYSIADIKNEKVVMGSYRKNKIYKSKKNDNDNDDSDEENTQIKQRSKRVILPIVSKNHEASVKKIKFSEENIIISGCRNDEKRQVVTCGYENVRFWRRYTSRKSVDGKEIFHSCPVVLNEYARGTTYTDIAFEPYNIIYIL